MHGHGTPASICNELELIFKDLTQMSLNVKTIHRNFSLFQLQYEIEGKNLVEENLSMVL